jgi:hypothetical protein
MGEPARKSDSLQGGPYRESYDSLLARCEALNKENMQLQWQIIQDHHRFRLEMRNLREQADHGKAQIEYMGNIIGELSARQRRQRVKLEPIRPTTTTIVLLIGGTAVAVAAFLAAAMFGWV